MALFSPTPLPPQRRPPSPPSLTTTTSSGVGSAAGTSTVQGFAPFGTGVSAGTSTVTGVGASLASCTGSSTGVSTASASASTGSIFPLTVSLDGRYLKQNGGTPFLICGQSVWSLAVNLPAADQTTFLATITGQGVNTVLLNAIEHHYTVVKPPKDVTGTLPFTKRLDGATYTGSPNGTTGASGTQGQFASDNYSSISTQSPDWTFPNNSYWLAVEALLTACVANNVLVLVWPGYLGFHAGDEGWLQEMVVLDAVTGAGGFTGQPWANAAKSKLWNYGAWLADRWKTYPNLIWVMGGDYGSGSQSLNTAEANAVSHLMEGLKSVSGQASTLFSAHWERPCISTDTTIAAGSFDLNFAYCDEAVAETTRLGYAHSPAIPTFLGEYNYEDGLFGGSAPWRKYLYWGFLSGIAGGFFGNEPLWRVDTDYATHMNTQGTQDAARQFTFWKSKAWHRLKPNGLGGIGTLITAGGGTASPQSTTYVAAAATSEGDLLMAYLPPAHTGSVTVDMSKMSATVQARWFDPSNATFTNIGAFDNSSTHAFTTTGNNNAGDADWLLLLETIAGTSTGTGSATGVGASVAATAGTSAGAGTAAAVGRSTAATTGTAAGVGAATAVSATVVSGTGTSTGSSTAAAVAEVLAAAVGSATGSAAAAGVGASTGTGTGSAASVGTALAVGASLSNTAGTASGTSTATAVGGGLAVGAGTGTVTGTSTAAAVGASFGAGTGLAASSSTVAGVGAVMVTAAGTAAGTATVTGVGGSLVETTGTAAGTSTVTGVGAILGTGAAAITLENDATSSTGSILLSGDASITVSDTVVSSTGATLSDATGSITLGDDTLLADGTITNTGAANIQLAGDNVAGVPTHRHAFSQATQVRTKRVRVIVRG